MAIFVPYCLTDDTDTVAERVCGWCLGFGSAQEALPDAAGDDTVVVEFPCRPANGFPKWIDLDFQVGFRVVPV